MIYSLFKERVYGYLFFYKISESDSVNSLIYDIFEEFSRSDPYRCVYQEYAQPLDFMNKEPYVSFLNGSCGYFLVASTLGEEIDKRIYDLKIINSTKGAVFDACTNAWLEIRNDELRHTLYDNISYLFCPGYQGSDVSELKLILDELNGESIGITLSSSNEMYPKKSMAGIYAKGVSPQKKCGNCVKLSNCEFRKAGKLCFCLEKKYIV